MGKSAKQLVDEVIATLPTEKFSVTALFGAKIIFQSLGTYVSMMGLIKVFTQKSTTIYTGSVAINLAVLTGGFLLVVLAI